MDIERKEIEENNAKIMKDFDIYISTRNGGKKAKRVVKHTS